MRKWIMVGLVAALAAASTWGCKFSASASGSVKSSGDADADAKASLDEDEANKDGATAAPSITLREGKLDYKGVINFEYNKANLRDDAETQKTLSEFQTFLEEHPDVEIQIEGHTDSRGSDQYNRDLSDRRAASVRAWLVGHGIPESRVTSIGKGEDDPQVPEPPACDDKVPANQAPCEEPWAINRRVVFQVTGGAETVEVAAAPKPEPEPEPEFEPLVEKKKCPWLWGGHANLLGPNSWVMLAGATQPGICWLEVSLGVGLGFGDFEAEQAMGGGVEGDYTSFTVPLRGRFWFQDRHSLLGDVGVGFTHYRISGEMTDPANMGGADYTRNTTPWIAHLGLGYGFRPNGAEAGPRLGVIVGGLFHLTDLGASEIAPPPGFGNALLIQDAGDAETDQLADVEPYGEVSLGWLF